MAHVSGSNVDMVIHSKCRNGKHCVDIFDDPVSKVFIQNSAKQDF
jgi:hypothetical protein